MIFIFAILAIFLAYRPWFLQPGTLSSGDWPYLFLESIKEFSFLPNPEFLWLAPYYQIPTKILVQYLGVPWEVSERILWFWPFLILSILSSYYLTKSWVSVLLYTTNTYVLMLVSGGQMGIALVYSIVPFVLKKFINLVDFYFSLSNKLKINPSTSSGEKLKTTIKNSKLLKGLIVAGLVLAIEVTFDPRIAYITLLAILIYFLFVFKNKIWLKEGIYSFIAIIILPLAIAICLNSYWIVPLLMGNLPAEHQGLFSVKGFEFLSFADFSHTFSLLHPNWHENVFGKTYFLQPEFLLLPILAYSSLFFLNSSKLKAQSAKLQLKSQKLESNLTIEQFSNRTSLGSLTPSLTPRGWYSFAPRENYNFTILFFTLLGLIGAFLAKGANEPFGYLNNWLFENFPGMNMFRDPTKFYLLTALSYSVLIPFSLYSAQEWLKSKVNPSAGSGQKSKIHRKYQIFNFSYARLAARQAFLIFAILYLIFLIRPAIFGELGGTFKPHTIPQEYILLKNFIVRQEDSFNTLWIPKVQRYGFHSKRNQAVSADQLLGASSILAILKEFQEPKIQKTIKNLNIRYIIVPYDSQKEIFLKDRKYDPHLYNSAVALLQKLEWIEKDSSFGNIIVFRVL